MKRMYVVLIFLIVTVPTVLSSMTEDWVYRYNGPENLSDRSQEVIFGSDGQLYTAGFNYYGYAYRALVICITPTGGQRWLYDYDVWGYEDAFNDLVQGIDGNLYATGYSDLGSGAGYDVIIASIDTAGEERWTFRYDAGTGVSDVGKSICSDSAGNVYAAGYSWISQILPLVVSVDSTGLPRWIYRPDSLPGFANSIACGPEGNLYVTGVYNGNVGSEFCVISLSPDGAERWVYVPSPESRGQSVPLTFDEDGSLYVSGDIGGLPTIISLDTSGSERWRYTYNDSLMLGGDLYAGITYANGSLYAAGGANYPTGISNRADWLVIGVDTTGQERWAYRYDYNGENDQATDMIWDSQTRRIYITGYSSQTILPVVCLDTDGREQWIYSYDYGPYDDAYAIAANGGQIAVAGESGDWDSEDLTVIRLSEGAIIRDMRDRPPHRLP